MSNIFTAARWAAPASALILLTAMQTGPAAVTDRPTTPDNPYRTLLTDSHAALTKAVPAQITGELAVVPPAPKQPSAGATTPAGTAGKPTDPSLLVDTHAAITRAVPAQPDVLPGVPATATTTVGTLRTGPRGVALAPTVSGTVQIQR